MSNIKTLINELHVHIPYLELLQTIIIILEVYYLL